MLSARLMKGGWPGLSRPLRRPGLLAGAEPTNSRVDSKSFALPRRPVRFDLYRSLFARDSAESCSMPSPQAKTLIRVSPGSDARGAAFPLACAHFTR
jgi:hypothetical protein